MSWKRYANLVPVVPGLSGWGGCTGSGVQGSGTLGGPAWLAATVAGLQAMDDQRTLT